MTTVSVVIVNYNHEQFLVEALESVFSQTYNVSQVILADDNSTDGSVAVARQAFPSVTVCLSESARSPLMNALQGLKCATGDLVFFLDSDDVWRPSKIELCVNEFLLNPSHIIVSHAHQRVDVNLRPIYFDDLTSRNIRDIFSGSSQLIQSRLRNSLLFRTGFWLGSAYGLRRSSLDIHKFCSFVERSHLSRYSYLDLVLAPYLASSNPSGTLGYLPGHTFLYRMHSSNSAASSSTSAQRIAIKRMLSTTLLTCRLLSLSGQPRWKVLNAYLPTVFYYRYLRALIDRRFLMALRYLFLSRHHLSSYPHGFVKEVFRVTLFLSPGGSSVFYLGKRLVFGVMLALRRIMDLF